VHTDDLSFELLSGYLDNYDGRFINFFNRIWGDRW
jgi:hypothetical protein